MLRTYAVQLVGKEGVSTGTVSAKSKKEAWNNATSKWKYSGYKVVSVSLK